jgi:DNA excision repair protein ERCC-2
VDEAHNLPALARDLATPRLGLHTLRRAQSEAREFGDPTVLRDVPLSRFLDAVAGVLVALKEELVPDGEEDAIVPPDELDVQLLSALRTSTPALDRALALMGEYGESVRAARRRRGKRPRSDVGAVARFLLECRALDAQTHAALVEVEDEEPRLVLLGLDASVLAAPAIELAAGSVHLSGTLHPLDEYRDSVGLAPARTDLASFPSPFPREHRLVLVDDTVTTRHDDVARDPALWHEMGARLRELRAATDRNVAIFLPSHDALHRLAPYVRGEGAYVEQRGSAQADLMAQVDAFRGTRGGTLVSVIGGRLSEGMDFPDDELEVVLVVGLPYARPTAKLEALVRFYDRRFGKGWEWAVKVPMVRRVLQAAGRLIRAPTDRGVVVLLDRRAAMLRDVLPDARVTSDPAPEVRAFFEGRMPS